jgi:hypothetical protein
MYNAGLRMKLQTCDWAIQRAPLPAAKKRSAAFLSVTIPLLIFKNKLPPRAGMAAVHLLACAYFCINKGFFAKLHQQAKQIRLHPIYQV